MADKLSLEISLDLLTRCIGASKFVNWEQSGSGIAFFWGPNFLHVLGFIRGIHGWVFYEVAKYPELLKQKPMNWGCLSSHLQLRQLQSEMEEIMKDDCEHMGVHSATNSR